MAKKTFKTPTETSERKGLSLLIGEESEIPKKNYYMESSYTTANVRVRSDLREKIYTLKGRTGMSLTDIYSEIFEYYFKNNPL